MEFDDVVSSEVPPIGWRSWYIRASLNNMIPKRSDNVSPNGSVRNKRRCRADPMGVYDAPIERSLWPKESSKREISPTTREGWNFWRNESPPITIFLGQILPLCLGTAYFAAHRKQSLNFEELCWLVKQELEIVYLPWKELNSRRRGLIRGLSWQTECNQNRVPSRYRSTICTLHWQQGSTRREYCGDDVCFKVQSLPLNLHTRFNCPPEALLGGLSLHAELQVMMYVKHNNANEHTTIY